MWPSMIHPKLRTRIPVTAFRALSAGGSVLSTLLPFVYMENDISIFPRTPETHSDMNLRLDNKILTCRK